jgi:hypothetical protein
MAPKIKKKAPGRRALAAGKALSWRAKFWLFENQTTRAPFWIGVFVAVNLGAVIALDWFAGGDSKSKSIALIPELLVVGIFGRLLFKAARATAAGRKSGAASPQKAQLEARIREMRAQAFAQEEAVALQAVVDRAAGRSPGSAGKAGAAGESARKPARL